MTEDINLKNEIVAIGHALADAARDAILPHFRGTALGTENKSSDGFDPVTIADRAAEASMREILTKRRPHDGIIGEEFGTAPGTSGVTWILDPVDGTRAFVAGAPVWGVLIAADLGNGPAFGIIDQPYIGERFLGGLGLAEMTGPRGRADLGVRDTTDLASATLLSTFPEIGSDAEKAAFDRVEAEVKLTRYGLDCYGYALLAAGQVDLVVEAGLHIYDIAGPRAVVEAAGGTVTDWQGGNPVNGGQVVAAATPALHAAALERLSGSS